MTKMKKGKRPAWRAGSAWPSARPVCISLEIGERQDGTRYPLRYEIDSLRCIYCGYCQEACPVNAIRLGAGYEYIYYRREDFILDKAKLLAMYDTKQGARQGAANEVKK